MKKISTIIVATFILISIASCSKEEPIFCSCTTTKYSESGEIISIINSSEDAPSDDSCNSLYSYEIDPETGIVTSRNCF